MATLRAKSEKFKPVAQRPRGQHGHSINLGYCRQAGGARDHHTGTAGLALGCCRQAGQARDRHTDTGSLPAAVVGKQVAHISGGAKADVRETFPGEHGHMRKTFTGQHGHSSSFQLFSHVNPHY